MKSRPMGSRAPAEIAQAAELLRRGQRKEAEAKCRAVVASAPTFAPAHHLLGVLLGERGETHAALAALERAVELAPGDAGAWMNLGVMQVRNDPSRAEACFRRVLKLAPGTLAARGNLATLLHEAGRYDEAEQHLRRILADAPDEPNALRLLARVKRMTRDYRTETEIIHRLLCRAPDDAELKANLSRAYFLWYDAVDTQPEAARAVLEEWLRFEPDAPVARHMLAALTARDVPAQAAPAYVQHHFDAFAATFDTVLASLQYRAPEIVRELLERALPAPSHALDVVDLGCGTGRLGPLIAPWKRALVGVDLSPRMLDEARKRAVYDELSQAEVTAYLTSTPGAFDLAACLDTLVYIGDVTALFEATFRALRAGGRFVGTIELQSEEAEAPFRLHEAGRYAHKASYVRARLEAAGFAMEGELVLETLRIQHDTNVRGLAFLAQRPA